MATSGVSFFKKKESVETQSELETIQKITKDSDVDSAQKSDTDSKPKHGEPGVCCGSCS